MKKSVLKSFGMHLVISVAAFVLLDLSALAFGFFISDVVEKDAVLINLAGRQRMLSQRTTKASLLAVSGRLSETEKDSHAKEAKESYALLLSTLSAFSNGGEAIGGDGRRVHLSPVIGQSALLVGQAMGLLTSAYQEYPVEVEDRVAFSEFMVGQNRQVLKLMNDLTSALEKNSIETVGKLRLVQSFVFLLSFINFALIIHMMHSARLEAKKASITDALTGLQNRGGFYAKLQEMVSHHQATERELSVLLVDLDGFKAVNDTYGHSAGDEILVEVARRLTSWCQEWELCGRLGGDEFVVLLPNIDGSAAITLANNLSSVLSGIPSNGLLVSGSVGYSTLRKNESADSFLSRADGLMYEVKGKKIKKRSVRGG